MSCNDLPTRRADSPSARRVCPAGRLSRLAAMVGLLAAMAMVRPAGADVFHLRDGGSVEGEQVGPAGGETIRIRTRRATVTLPSGQVIRVERSQLSWKVYESMAARYPDTAEAHYRLGLWCRQNDLDDLANVEFARALQLDGNHAGTRELLGHVRVGDAWLDLTPQSATRQGTAGGSGSAATADGSSSAADGAGAGGSVPATAAGAATSRPEVEPADPAVAEAERELVRSVQGAWSARIRSIRTRYLDTGSRSRFAQGAELLLAIRDPLAVEPMIEQLGDGPRDQRRLLATVLGRMSRSAATLELIEMALLDEDESVRKSAFEQLDRRDDPRVAAMLIKALASDDDAMVCNAANALGYMRRVDAVPALVEALTDKKERRVRVDSVVRSIRRTFVDTQGRLHRSTGSHRRDPFHPQYKTVTVTLLRTEVQESLMAITGENFGFDSAGWLEWYRRRVADVAATQRQDAGQLAPPALK